MKMPNEIDAVLTDGQVKEALQYIEEIQQVLPFLVAITPAERQNRPKMGERTRPFVEKALEIASQNEEILPRYFEIEPLQRDLALYKQLSVIRLNLSQLLEKIDDTMLLAGSEAFTAGLIIYRALKNTPASAGLEGTLKELARRFRGQGSSEDSDDSQDPQNTPS